MNHVLRSIVFFTATVICLCGNNALAKEINSECPGRLSLEKEIEKTVEAGDFKSIIETVFKLKYEDIPKVSSEVFTTYTNRDYNNQDQEWSIVPPHFSQINSPIVNGIDSDGDEFIIFFTVGTSRESNSHASYYLGSELILEPTVVSAKELKEEGFVFSQRCHGGDRRCGFLTKTYNTKKLDMKRRNADGSAILCRERYYYGEQSYVEDLFYEKSCYSMRDLSTYTDTEGLGMRSGRIKGIRTAECAFKRLAYFLREWEQKPEFFKAGEGYSDSDSNSFLNNMKRDEKSPIFATQEDIKHFKNEVKKRGDSLDIIRIK